MTNKNHGDDDNKGKGIDLKDSDEQKSQTAQEDEVTAEQAEDTAAAKIETLGQIFEDFKKQLTPVAKNFKEILEKANSTLVATSAEKGQDNEAEANQEPAAQSQESSAAPGEGAEVINLALERLKRRGIQRNIDIKSILSQQFDDYVDKKLNPDEIATDEEGKKRVNVDSKFLQNHGKELVPYLIGGIAQGIFGNIFGPELLPKSETSDEEKAGAEIEGEDKAAFVSAQPGEEAAEEQEGSEKEPKYKVSFSIADVITNFMQNAKPVNPPKTPEELAESENARQALIKAGEVFEDTLNGKAQLSDVKAALDTPPQPEEEGPVDIVPEDEKHAKILAMAKEFERSVDKKPEE